MPEESMKGRPCPRRSGLLCQEGYCSGCWLGEGTTVEGVWPDNWGDAAERWGYNVADFILGGNYERVSETAVEGGDGNDGEAAGGVAAQASAPGPEANAEQGHEKGDRQGHEAEAVKVTVTVCCSCDANPKEGGGPLVSLAAMTKAGVSLGFFSEGKCPKCGDAMATVALEVPSWRLGGRWLDR